MIYTQNGETRKANQRVGTIKLQIMKNLQCQDLKNPKTNKLVSFIGVKVVLAALFLTVFVVSCSKDDIQEQVSTEQISKETSKETSNAGRYYYYSIIVRNWGSHNVDCSQPNGFCHEVWTFTYSLFRPQPTGTPVGVENAEGSFVMKIYKSALTEEHKRTLLRNRNYSIPEGQTIPEEIVESLGFRSNTLRPGEYRIVDNRDSYTISIPVN